MSLQILVSSRDLHVAIIIIIIISGVFVLHLHEPRPARHYKVWIKWNENERKKTDCRDCIKLKKWLLSRRLNQALVVKIHAVNDVVKIMSLCSSLANSLHRTILLWRSNFWPISSASPAETAQCEWSELYIYQLDNADRRQNTAPNHVWCVLDMDK